MRIVLALSTLLVSLSGAPAQNPQNTFFKFDATIEFVSRGGLGSSPGRLSQGFAPGFSAGLRTLTYLQYTIQDQDRSTQEPWDIGTCGLDATGRPDYPNTTVYASNLTMPIATGIGSITMLHTALANSPVRLAASSEQWHHVWHFKNMANWTTDGISLQMSQGASWGTPPTLFCQASSHREIPRADGNPQVQIIEKFGWSNGANQTPPAILDRSWACYLGFAELVLNGGSSNAAYNSPCPNPNFGYASLDPDFADNGLGTPPRYDNPHWLVNGGPNYAGGISVLLMSMALLPGDGVAVPPYGRLYLDLLDPLAAIGPIVMPPMHPSRGYSEMTFDMGPATSPIRKVAAALPAWSAQAVVIASGQPTRLTNPFTFRPILLPPGFTAATAVQGTPHLLPRTTSHATFAIRNDGIGTLSVQQKVAQTNIGPAVSIPEFCMVRITPAVAANTIEISSTKTTPTDFVWAFNQ